MLKVRFDSRATRRLFGTLIAASLAATLVIAAGPGSAAGAPGAQSAAKRKACKPRAINSLPTRKAKRNRRRDCKDKVLGNPERPRRQRYDGKRIPTPNSSRCDILDRAVCLQPWPNDFFTKSASSATGRRLNLNAASMPANINGNRISPTDYNRADGFSPGQLIVTNVPGLNNQTALAKTNPVDLTDLSAYTDANTPIVVINADTGLRHPIFAEIDTRASGNDVNLEIRASVNFEEGGHYIVALRNLKNSAGRTIRSSKTFRLYRDRLITRQKPIESRRKHIESLIRTLKSAGIRRGNLFLTWDFTISSEGNLSNRVLSMRNDAFSQLGDTDLDDFDPDDGNEPEFSITNVAVDTGDTDDWLRRIDGTVEVPCYLSHPTDADECAPGAQFAYSGPDDLTPNRVGSATTDAPFRCIIPDQVDDGSVIDDSRPTMFGHGLLGNRFNVDGLDTGAQESNFTICSMNWDGFSSDDVATGIVPSLTNLTNFPKIADAVQQSFVNFLYMGRGFVREDGFNSVEAFQVDPDNPEALEPNPNDPGSADADTDPVIDTSDFSPTRNALSYFGISHGGIMGGALTALAPDHQRAVLNVPAMNHSNLLERSIHWDNYGAVFNSSYPNEIERPQILSMIQMLWDRAENNGYAHHITSDPYPNTPAHTVLMQTSYGDHQVTNYAAEIMARTIGARVLTPALDPGLRWDTTPFFGIQAVPSVPYTGSALVYWFGGPTGFNGLSGQGTAKPPLTNIPPRAAQGFGGDPHEYIIKDPEGRRQLSDFLQLGQLTDCGGDPPPCHSNGF